MSIRREQILTVVVLTGLTLAFVAAVALPGRQARAALRNEISESERDIARSAAALDRFRVARNSLEAHRSHLRSSSATVAGPDDVLQAISRVARRSGLSVIRIEPVAVRTQATYAEHPFQLDFRAKLGALTEFLKGIESGGRLYVIEELNLRSRAAQQNSETLEGTVRFSVYAATDGSEALDE